MEELTEKLLAASNALKTRKELTERTAHSGSEQPAHSGAEQPANDTDLVADAHEDPMEICLAPNISWQIP